ncbi:phytoene synthase [Kushneria sinocarnis]|uniref:Phytoene synthase n=1 Tax=Kushneria sinocarnis TaxID=595502 RepID=A0A420WVI7_9GAMM|nr:phytoene/squalene synthase family protein [Kushneria sinocarnis]RKR02552.1 phytoene synthase [Kushneria sinocarnis]
MDPARQTLAQHGKSFWFASRFMERHDTDDAARLYMACRELDDLADQELPDPQQNERARDRLMTIRREIQARRGHDPLSLNLLDLSTRRGVDLEAATALIDALIRDVDRPATVATEAELLDYCYGVAGTVGVMMCAVIGARPEASAHAIDLGMAMQMTNIARDVLEDAGQGRRYLPGEWLEQRSATRLAATRQEDHAAVAAAVERLLHLSEAYYCSAADGFNYIPRRNRRAIRVAAEVYRGIGRRLARSGHAWHQGRVHVPLGGKLWLATRTLGGQGDIRAPGRARHDPELHRHIAHRPGADAGVREMP